MGYKGTFPGDEIACTACNGTGVIKGEKDYGDGRDDYRERLAQSISDSIGFLEDDQIDRTVNSILALKPTEPCKVKHHVNCQTDGRNHVELPNGSGKQSIGGASASGSERKAQDSAMPQAMQESDQQPPTDYGRKNNHMHSSKRFVSYCPQCQLDRLDAEERHKLTKELLYNNDYGDGRDITPEDDEHIAWFNMGVRAGKQSKPDCYCVCHNPISSRPWCEHCKGDNEVGRAHKGYINGIPPEPPTETEAELDKAQDLKDELLYDLHLRSCVATDPAGPTQQNCEHHKSQLRIAIERIVAQERKKAAIEELETWVKRIDDFNSTPREPGMMYTDNFGSAGASMERDGFVKAFTARIAELNKESEK